MLVARDIAPRVLLLMTGASSGVCRGTEEMAIQARKAGFLLSPVSSAILCVISGMMVRRAARRSS